MQEQPMPAKRSGCRKIACTGLLLFVMATAGAAVVPPPESGDQYFPHLQAMQEPSLYKQRGQTSPETYRFLWFRSFDEPTAVRVWRDAGGAWLHVVELSKPRNSALGHIAVSKTIALSAGQWQQIQRLLKQMSFWGMPAKEKDAGGLDGADWTIEGLRHGKYHRVYRWTPSDSTQQRGLGNFVALCRFLIDLSGLKIPDARFY